MRLYPVEKVREIDKKAEEAYRISSLILMENAGRGTAEEIIKRYPQRTLKIVVISGKGNNGGDGFVVARQLEIEGYKNIEVLCLAPFEKYKGDAKANLEILLKTGFDPQVANSEKDVKRYVKSADLIIDAIFGTGLSSEVQAPYSKIIEEINKSPARVCSVDIPSGVNGNTGEVMGTAVKADFTVTLAVAKPGLYSYPGKKYAGQIVLSHIGIPAKIINSFETNYFAIDEEEVRKRLKTREPDIHKGRCGHLLVVGGSAGKCGAVSLSGEGALRSGVGLVTAMLPASEQPVIDGNVQEMMTIPVREDGDFMAYSSFKELFKRNVEGKSAIAAGPGLGVGEDQFQIVRDIIESGLPAVLDADALNSIKNSPEILKKNSRLVITPHPGEFSRLSGLSTSEIQKDRLNVSLEFAKEYGCVVVLKGAGTVVASPEGSLFINTTGNHGMATGGMGDVLCGIIGSLLSQGYSPLESALIGVYLHGLSADLIAGEPAVQGYTASDVAKGLRNAFEKLYCNNQNSGRD